MSSNPSTPVAVTAAESSTQLTKVKPKAVGASPVKKTSSATVKASERKVIKRTTPVATRKVVAAPAKSKKVKPVVTQTVPLKPRAIKMVAPRPPKIKMVRDSFTFPETEHKRLVEMKKLLIALGTEVKKGELVRAGLELLAKLDNQHLLRAVADVEKLKTGRPKK